MGLKNDCERDYIKEAFIKLYNHVMPYIDLTQFDDAQIAFNELENKVHSEIYILKKCLAESDRAVDAGLTRSEVLQERISDLEKKIHELEEENANLRVTPPDANAIEVLKKENSDLKMRNFCLTATCNTRSKSLSEATKELEQYKKNNIRQRGVIDNLEKETNNLKKKIHDLEEETADDAIRIKSLERANSVLRGDNKTLWSKLEECDIPTREQASYKSLVEAIEFQNKKIEELEAEKASLKEAYDIHETTTKKENVDLSYGHEFEFGDEVFVPWSDGPYMYVKCGIMYNPRTKRLVYVGKDQHLKWFGEKFSIV